MAESTTKSYRELLLEIIKNAKPGLIDHLSYPLLAAWARFLKTRFAMRIIKLDMMAEKAILYFSISASAMGPFSARINKALEKTDAKGALTPVQQQTLTTRMHSAAVLSMMTTFFIVVTRLFFSGLLTLHTYTDEQADDVSVYLSLSAITTIINNWSSPWQNLLIARGYADELTPWVSASRCTEAGALSLAIIFAPQANATCLGLFAGTRLLAQITKSIAVLRLCRQHKPLPDFVWSQQYFEREDIQTTLWMGLKSSAGDFVNVVAHKSLMMNVVNPIEPRALTTLSAPETAQGFVYPFTGAMIGGGLYIVGQSQTNPQQQRRVVVLNLLANSVLSGLSALVFYWGYQLFADYSVGEDNYVRAPLRSVFLLAALAMWFNNIALMWSAFLHQHQIIFKASLTDTLGCVTSIGLGLYLGKQQGIIGIAKAMVMGKAVYALANTGLWHCRHLGLDWQSRRLGFRRFDHDRAAPSEHVDENSTDDQQHAQGL